MHPSSLALALGRLVRCQQSTPDCRAWQPVRCCHRRRAVRHRHDPGTRLLQPLAGAGCAGQPAFAAVGSDLCNDSAIGVDLRTFFPTHQHLRMVDHRRRWRTRPHRAHRHWPRWCDVVRRGLAGGGSGVGAASACALLGLGRRHVPGLRRHAGRWLCGGRQMHP